MAAISLIFSYSQMWYHYLILLVGLYFVVSGIQHLIGNSVAFNATGWVFWIIGRLFGLGLIYWAYTGITAPAPTMIPTVGGGRRRR